LCEIVKAVNSIQLEQVRTLFTEYRAELAVEPCLRSFDEEIATLPGAYASPRGTLLLATVAGQPVGCVGLRPFPANETCEVKRLYVRPTFRGSKIGRMLTERVLQEARDLGYRSVRLDSHPPTMASAIRLYRQLGFREVSAEPLEPIEGLIYMESDLATQEAKTPE